MSRTLRTPSQRTQKRLIIAMVLTLAIGIPAIGVLYFFDQYRDPGPNLVDRTIQAAEEAVRANPNSLNVRFALGKAYDEAGRRTDAIAQYDQLLNAAPKAAAVLIARANDHLILGTLDAAAADYQAVVDNLKGAEMANVSQDLEAAYFGLGAVALKRGDATTATAQANAALKINRTDADALNLLGDALAKTGDSVGAVAAYRRAVALVPVDWCDPYSGLVQAYAVLKDQAGVGYANAMLAFCQGRYDEAKSLLQAQTSGPYALDAFVGLGLLAEKQGDGAGAAAAYRMALAKDPSSLLANTGLGRVSEPHAGSSASAAPSSSGSN